MPAELFARNRSAGSSDDWLITIKEAETFAPALQVGRGLQRAPPQAQEQQGQQQVESEVVEESGHSRSPGSCNGTNQ